MCGAAPVRTVHSPATAHQQHHSSVAGRFGGWSSRAHRGLCGGAGGICGEGRWCVLAALDYILCYPLVLVLLVLLLCVHGGRVASRGLPVHFYRSANGYVQGVLQMSLNCPPHMCSAFTPPTTSTRRLHAVACSCAVQRMWCEDHGCLAPHLKRGTREVCFLPFLLQHTHLPSPLPSLLTCVGSV